MFLLRFSMKEVLMKKSFGMDFELDFGLKETG